MARDGNLFQDRRGHPSEIPHARALAGFSGRARKFDGAHRNIRGADHLFIFAAWIFYAFAVVALFRMRRTEPDLPRPYRCWGYPWVPGLFVAGALALTVNIWIDRPGRSSIGLLLILRRDFPSIAAGTGLYQLPAILRESSRRERKYCARSPPTKSAAPGARTHANKPTNKAPNMMFVSELIIEDGHHRKRNHEKDQIRQDRKNDRTEHRALRASAPI